MKINISTLKAQSSLTFSGDESWLKEIYAEFPYVKEEKITAEVLLTDKTESGIEVEGNINFNPPLECGRCQDPIPWPINIDFKVLYRPESATPHYEPNQEVDLTKADLDQYYIENNEIDLGQLVAELVFLEVPTSCVKADETNSACYFCKKDLNKPTWHQSKSDEPSGPFAELSKLLQ